jgi:hypothetical protein
MEMRQITIMKMPIDPYALKDVLEALLALDETLEIRLASDGLELWAEVE